MTKSQRERVENIRKDIDRFEKCRSEIEASLNTVGLEPIFMVINEAYSYLDFYSGLCSELRQENEALKAGVKV